MKSKTEDPLIWQAEIGAHFNGAQTVRSTSRLGKNVMRSPSRLDWMTMARLRDSSKREDTSLLLPLRPSSTAVVFAKLLSST
jgi:hypothetical protein